MADERTRPVVPYGSWPSPLSAATVATGSVHAEVVAVEDDDIYWIERRPDEGGRSAVVCRRGNGTMADVTPPGTNVRSRVHEYGGGSCLVDAGVVYYSDFQDQRLYRLVPGQRPVALTPEGPWRYADAAIDPVRKRLICIREDHSLLAAGGRVSDSGSQAPAEAVNTLVSIPLEGRPTAGEVIAHGDDFYSTPRFNPDGSRLCWISWRHPQMPWDGTELWVARIDAAGRLSSRTRIAGSDRESIVQPGWTPDGALTFVSDRSGWWNLYAVRDGTVEPLLPMAAEFARPPWELGHSSWAQAPGGSLAVSFCHEGVWRLATLDTSRRALRELVGAPEPGPVLLATATHAVYVGRSPIAPDAVVRTDLATGATAVVHAVSAPVLDPRFISRARAIAFTTDDGGEARLFYYAPVNPEVVAPAADRPPLIVIGHGGPTSAAMTKLHLVIQYWTTRGFAVADVDYRGSTGYGRAFRERLNGEWGVADVADCVKAARHLAEAGLADPARLIMRGSSAGGFTTLAALVQRPGVFSAAACYYGISDLEALARDTHKFESRYTDGLIAPWPARADLYRARSPIHAVDRLSCPLILFHGREDRAVPVNQSELMAEVLRRKGLQVELHVFDGEQHGFRRHDTIERCLEAELAFYRRVLTRF